jgi:glycosyltransferase involved in cell wall biosynthesis
MDIAILNFDWRICVVVTPDNLANLPASLNSIARNSVSTDHIVLACDKPSVRHALKDVSIPVQYVLPSKISAGSFWTTVCAAQGSPDRTIFLVAGILVPPQWDARLAAVGQRLPDVAAVTPLCARHPVTSLFNSPDHRPGLDVEALDQWLCDYSHGGEFAIPVLPENCLLLQGLDWTSVLATASDDRELMSALRQRGASVLASTQLYLDDSAVEYGRAIDDLPQALANASLYRSPLSSLRHSLTELSARSEQPSELRSCLPVQLHVGHSWGGGLGRWIEDYIAADAAHNHLVLRSIGDLSGFGLTIGLYRSMAMDSPVKTWTLSEPILSLSIGSYEYRQIVTELVEIYHVESLVISSLIGHSLDLLQTGLPTTLVMHDFFPYCPALYATYGSPCQSCNAERLSDCARNNPQHAYFKFETDAHWMSARRLYLALLFRQDITLVAPSESVVNRYRQLVPELAEQTMHVIPHGLEQTLIESLAPNVVVPNIVVSNVAEPIGDGRLQVVVTGRLTPEKGADILSEVIDSLQDVADFHLLGTGESGKRFEGRSAVTVQRFYHTEELGDLLASIAPDVALLLSVVPETFSYTLSELHAAGIPVIATRMGAFIERIQEGENGWLVEPETAAVIDCLRHVAAHRQELAVTQKVLAAQTVRTTQQMVRDYALLWTEYAAVPVHRYDLPLRTYANPYAKAADVSSDALIIGHQVPYRRVLAEFLHYSAGKMSNSPRLPAIFGRVLAGLFRQLGRWFSP